VTPANPPTPSAPAVAPVIQADREAAARWAKSNSRHAQAANMRRGSCDTAPLVQAFAAHRIAATAKLVDALEAINRLISPGSRTFDEMIRDMGYACDTARAALALTQGDAS
jgi:hypothetical protein